MKTKGVFIFVFCLCVSLVFGQWVDQGSDGIGNIYYTGGKVGIGTTGPGFALGVSGGIRLFPLNSNAKFFEMGHGGANGFISVRGGGRLDFRIASTNILSMSEDFKVGIGTTNPQSLLSVKGKIESQEVQVKTNVADYVFEEDYNFLSLEELEQYININGHLPSIQTQKDVDNNRGLVKIGELSVSLMAKVEELTLHMIEMNKSLKEVQLENVELKKKINSLVKE